MADDIIPINSPSPGSQTPSSRPVPFREDCWTEDATWTLVEAWGRRYVELNRGNLRQKDWQEVADAVNLRHGVTKKTRRTDVQCKNRIDTLKKKYKVEKARVSGSGSGSGSGSNWPFFSRLDTLIGSARVSGSSKKSSSASPPTAVPLPYRKPPSTMTSSQTPQPQSILPMKRPLPVAAAVDESYFRRNYSAVAAAAAAAEEDGTDDEVSVGSSDDEGAARGKGVAKEGGTGTGTDTDSMKRLAMAIERFGEIYERVEGEKQKQMIELEKQRMQFTKDLEVQRMQLFMDTQVQLEKIKQAKRAVSVEDDVYS
ncbi:trihelix transcription factor ENAP1-like [Bidens hawaiensis]|uniref:trihelix transcription factor ENAP1-like n=1 Tax=Bidens hawaiensis TaxID=980011 RepID=UPI00404B1D45